MYAMIIGKLPFTTHYTDQYRRLKLLSQIEKGITEVHLKELSLHGVSHGIVSLFHLFFFMISYELTLLLVFLSVTIFWEVSVIGFLCCCFI